MHKLALGIYDQVVDEELKSLLDTSPDLTAVLRQIDDELAPELYAQFIARLVAPALRSTDKELRVSLVNRIIDLLSQTDGLEYLARRRLLSDSKTKLTEVRDTEREYPRPTTPLSTSALLTGQGVDPTLEHELRAEMLSANRVDILISFIKWSGLRLLSPAFEELENKNIPVRIISTSYMGASDPEALRWLSNRSNVEVRVSYDTERTRLHAKAYHFHRQSGFSTAYIGSANMSHAAMTQGLEWTVKVTGQDMPHILERFAADFASYWEKPEFELLTAENFSRLSSAISEYKRRATVGPQFFADITPRPFQQRILESLTAARQNGEMRNLVVAATGTGKTVISALDYKRRSEEVDRKEPLLFVAHRKEILEQALSCFRTVLRDQNFGELLVGGIEPQEWRHVFASVQTLQNREPWRLKGADYFRFVILDEAHHGTAESYRPIFNELQPEILLGLTATPERMDGSRIVDDFGGRYTAEIRLPEALDERLLCPFHYFGVSDSIDLEDERFWRNGRYDQSALESVLTGDDIRAKQRAELVLESVHRYQPDISSLKAVGFCAGVKHAQFMAKYFNAAGQKAEVILGATPPEMRSQIIADFRSGLLPFLFVVDVFSEGIDIPEINMVLFLRPTESLTVFLQQLGRGLRHAPNKDCLTVLDFVGQTHRKYRLETKYTALLSRNRQRIDREIENDFPNLPAGCSIILERVARERVLRKVKAVLNDLQTFIPEVIRTWASHSEVPLSFGNFIAETRLSPIDVLKKRTWSEWKALASSNAAPTDPDLATGRKALVRLATRSDPEFLSAVDELSGAQDSGKLAQTYGNTLGTAVHYTLWGQKASAVGVSDLCGSFEKWRANKSVAMDAREIAQWRRQAQQYPVKTIDIGFPCFLKLHAAYDTREINAALGLNTLRSSGPTGVGVLHNKERKVYAHLVTFRKVESDFSPTTLYRDYPISQRRLHWESQSTITQRTPTGENYIQFQHRGYTILFFARVEKQVDGATAPFLYLGPASKLISYEGDRPISMVWELEYPMPAALFEEARAA